MTFYEDMVKALNEAIEMKQGKIPTRELNGMPAKTLVADVVSKRQIEEEEPLPDELNEIKIIGKAVAFQSSVK